jgi:hypothetical protein
MVHNRITMWIPYIRSLISKYNNFLLFNKRIIKNLLDRLEKNILLSRHTFLTYGGISTHINLRVSSM